MDTVVVPAGTSTWELKDLLGRQLGTITQAGDGRFRISRLAEKFSGINTGPFDSIDLTLSEIERITKSACRIDPGT